MCIIATDSKTSSKDLRVHNTQIFVAPNKARTRQITVYQNTVACDVKSLMILPIPHPQSFRVETECPTGIFEQLYNSVRYPEGAHSRLAIRSLAWRSAVESLPKFSMPGGYIASLAPTLDDIQHVDSATFEIPQDVLVFLAEQYGQAEYPMGFLVCKLSDEQTTEVEYTPICYSHQSIAENKLFVPTLHYHGHQADTVDWDHYIYSTATDIYANTPGFIPRDINAVLWKVFPLEFQYDRLAKIHCLRIIAPTPARMNKDLFFTVPFTRVANEWTGLAF
jgi:hypothetical protein